MSTETNASDLLTIYDNAKLTPRYWLVCTLLMLHEMFDYYDFYIVGYLVAILAPAWHLTYGQSAGILLAAGFGAVIGALVFGKVADVMGRKPLLVFSGFLVAASAGGIALIPKESWILFSLLRIVVGFGIGGAIAAQNALIVEFAPTRYRTFLSGIMIAPVSLGILIAAILSSLLLPIIGWRGLAAIGAAPAVLATAVIFLMPESPRWLLARDRFVEARAAVALQLGVSPESLPMPTASKQAPPPAPLRELLKHRRAFWLLVLSWIGMSTTTYGYQLWSPTILAMVMKIPVKAVAGYFIIIAIAGLIGRFVFSTLPLFIGRRHSGEVMGWGAAIFILLAGIYHNQYLAGLPAFVVWLTLAAVFVNGGFSNVVPHTLEIFPVRLVGRATGASQAVNSIGRILGPAFLGLIAGTGNVVNPQATEKAVLPAFIFLSCCCLISGLSYTLLPIETHGRPLTLKGEDSEKTSDVSATAIRR
ncbi:MAG: MFS transporter [Candidatus Korobacteraceae bacterium]|jgi:putative MFS transporter